MRRIAVLAFIQLLLLSACGGSGSNALGGSGSGSGSGQTIASAAANVATLTIDTGPAGATGAINEPFVTITLCAPGSTTNCQTIDHIEVDTASYGLRIIASVLNSSLLSALPVEGTAGFGVPIAECTIFGDGYSWGSMRQADLEVSGEKAASLPMQVIGDPNFTNVPTDCSTSSTGPEEDTVALFGANGIIGIGPFAQDCGDACVNSTSQGFYYSCPTGGGACSPTQVQLAQEATNPVVAFTTDNNGTIVELPAIQDQGSLTVTGALVFGIGTQGNNGLGSATVLTTDTTNGYITVDFNSQTYADSFLDSGSNLLFFNVTNNLIATCSLSKQSFYCPSSQQTYSAVNIGLNNVQSSVTFKVGNASTVLQNEPSFAAFDNLAAPAPGQTGFDFGLPFFYGRNVFTAIDGMNTAGGMGPYVAY